MFEYLYFFFVDYNLLDIECLILYGIIVLDIENITNVKNLLRFVFIYHIQYYTTEDTYVFQTPTNMVNNKIIIIGIFVRYINFVIDLLTIRHIIILKTVLVNVVYFIKVKVFRLVILKIYYQNCLTNLIRKRHKERNLNTLNTFYRHGIYFIIRKRIYRYTVFVVLLDFIIIGIQDTIVGIRILLNGHVVTNGNLDNGYDNRFSY